MRQLVWKLADQVLVFADGRGFVEMAWPGEAPGGVLRWCARMVMTTGLLDAVWWVPYVVLGGAVGGALARLFFPRAGKWWLLGMMVLGAGAAFIPVWFCGDAVWFQRESAFPMIGLLGLLAMCGMVVGLRPLAQRSGWGLLMAEGICGLLWVPLGNFAGLAGAVLLVQGAGGARARFLAFNLWWAALPCVCRWVYADLALMGAVDPSFYWYRMSRPGEPVPAITLYRYVREANWQGALAYVHARREQGCDFPLRMEIAYRLLAQLRAGTLLEDLFHYPIRTHAATTDARQLSYAGYELLFQYGWLQPARRELMEEVTVRKWRPEHLLRLGDIALLQGDKKLAERDYRHLARCPFRRALAKSRLEVLAGRQPLPADLQPVAAAARIWDESFPRGFYDSVDQVEDFIYHFHMQLTVASRAMSEVCLAALMLDARLAELAARTDLIAQLYPGSNPWPTALQEAMVAYCDILAPKEREEFLQRLPPSALAAETFQRYRRFIAAWEKLPRVVPQAEKDLFRQTFGRTFWFYTWWVDVKDALVAREARARVIDRRRLEQRK